MARKTFEISFNIAGKLTSSFRASFSSAASEMDRLRNASINVKTSIRELEKQYKGGTVSAEQYRAAHERLTKQLDRVNKAQERLAETERRQQQLRQRSSEIAGQMATTAAFAAPLVFATKSAVDFETAMLGVAKQVQGARDESGKLTAIYYEMAEQIKALGREIPIPTNEIAAMVEAAARMNVPKEQLISYTREVAKMATALEMTPDIVSDQMGKIANVMQIPIQQIGDLADTINYLDDNSVAKGADIIGVLQRIGGTAKQVNITADQAAALGSTFLSLGKSEEVASTAANALMRELAIANQQPKRFQKGLEMLGMTSEEVNKSMVKDAQGTILKVLDAINKLPKERQAEATTLLFGKEYGDDIAALAGAVNEYRRQIDLLDDAQRKGSVNREFEARMQSTAAQLQLLKNNATEAAVNIGTVLLPPLNDLAKSLSSITNAVAEFSKEYPNLTKAIVLGSAGLLTATFGWLSLRFAINSVKLATTGLKKFLAVGEAGAAARAASKTVARTTSKTAANVMVPPTKGVMSPISKAGGKLATVGKLAGRAALPLAIASEAVNIATAENKTRATAQAVGGIGGGLAGAKIGAAVGTAIAPGIGTAIGGLIGSVGGYLLGKFGAGKIIGGQGRESDNAKQAALNEEMNNASTKLVNTQKSADNLKNSFDSLTNKLNEIQGGIGNNIVYLTYSPVINGGSGPEISSILNRDKDNLIQRLEGINHQQRRVSFSAK